MPPFTLVENRAAIAVALGLTLVGGLAHAADIGIAPLRALQPTLLGSNVIVGQVEVAITNAARQVNPVAVGLPTSRFTWNSSGGSSTAYPNALGIESSHADAVGGLFYSANDGV